MHKNKILHFIILVVLLSVLAYLWLRPTGNIKPGGFKYPLILMIIGTIVSIYIININRKLWILSKDVLSGTNVALAGIFIIFHVIAFGYVLTMLGLK